jgi:hypothetical protein
MKAFLFMVSFVLVLSSFSVSAKNVKHEKKVKSCSLVMEEIKKSQKQHLFVGFAKEEVVKKIRKDFPDLIASKVEAFSHCLVNEAMPEASFKGLLLVTVPKTLTNSKRLQTYNIKNAG